MAMSRRRVDDACGPRPGRPVIPCVASSPRPGDGCPHREATPGLFALAATHVGAEGFAPLMAGYVAALLPHDRACLLVGGTGQRVDVERPGPGALVSASPPAPLDPQLASWLEGCPAPLDWVEPEQRPSWLSAEPAGPGLAFPLQAGDRPSGCLVLFRSADAPFTEADRATAAWLSRPLGACLGTVVALDASARTVERLRTLHSLSAEFLQVHDEGVLARRVATAAHDLFGTAAAVTLFLEREGRMAVVASAGPALGMASPGVVVDEPDVFPFTALAPSVMGGVRWTAGGGLPTVIGAPVRSSLAVPVGPAHARLGVLVLSSLRDEGLFDESDLHLACILANHAGGALGTARMLAQAERRKAEIEEEGRQRIEFVAGLVHEVKTPLTVFRGFIDLLGEEELSPDGRRYLELMARDAGRLSRTMTELLHLARLESGHAPRTARRVVLREIAERVLDEFRRPCADKGLALTASLDGLAVAGVVDDEKLVRILRNLLENAVKFTEPGGSVSMEGAVRDGWATLTVVDTGRGVEDEHLPHLTESFYQVRRSGAENKDGVGLGLAIVKRLLDSLGGALTIESRPGEGSRFSVAFLFDDAAEGGCRCRERRS